MQSLWSKRATAAHILYTKSWFCYFKSSWRNK